MALALLLTLATAGCTTSVQGNGTRPTPATGSTATSAAGTAVAAPPTSSSASAAATTVPTEADGSDGSIGNPGIGDPYYPSAGNGGYQVDSYDVTLIYTPDTNDLQAIALVTGSVLSDDGLTRFNLDLQPALTVENVLVDGSAAEFEQQDAELVITPATLLAAGAPLRIEITYGGEPGAISEGTAGLGDGGWIRTSSGGVIAVGEPFSASAWYPVNEHPADPATFAVTATVPDGWQVMSIGLPQLDGLPPADPGWVTFRWEFDTPIASYLTTLYIDKFTVLTDSLPDGTPVISAIGPAAGGDETIAEQTANVIEGLEQYFGEYPYTAAGGIYTGEDLGFALETASRPVYTADPSMSFLVHEQAHQWFGDLVTIGRWADICLNECVASYADWLWQQETRGADLDLFWKDQMTTYVGQSGYWSDPLVDMGAGSEFRAVYTRGPVALHALRHEMGDDAFFALLRDWPAEYGGQVVRFDDLEDLASELAGRDLRPFMDAWFRSTGPPPEEFRYPGTLAK